MKSLKEGLSREELRAIVEPLINELDEFEGDRGDFYITWNFGLNKNGEVTGGLDITIDGENANEDNIKSTLEAIFRKHGFALDDDITHENPIQTWMGAWHYQIKQIDSDAEWHDTADQEQVDEPDYTPELVDDDMNAGMWYESLEEDLASLFKHVHDTDEDNFNLHGADYTPFYTELMNYMKPGESWDDADLAELFRRMPKAKQADFLDRFYLKEGFSGFFSDYNLEGDEPIEKSLKESTGIKSFGNPTSSGPYATKMSKAELQLAKKIIASEDLDLEITEWTDAMGNIGTGFEGTQEDYDVFKSVWNMVAPSEIKHSNQNTLGEAAPTLGSVEDYLAKMKGKSKAEAQKIVMKAKGNPNAEEAYKKYLDLNK